MTTQETMTNAAQAASGSGVAIVVAVAVAVLFWLGIEWVLDVLDLHLPARQLAQGRSTLAFPEGLRWVYWQVVARRARAVVKAPLPACDPGELLPRRRSG